jgi:hypothetical protein
LSPAYACGLFAADFEQPVSIVRPVSGNTAERPRTVWKFIAEYPLLVKMFLLLSAGLAVSGSAWKYGIRPAVFPFSGMQVAWGSYLQSFIAVLPG